VRSELVGTLLRHITDFGWRNTGPSRRSLGIVIRVKKRAGIALPSEVGAPYEKSPPLPVRMRTTTPALIVTLLTFSYSSRCNPVAVYRREVGERNSFFGLADGFEVDLEGMKHPVRPVWMQTATPPGRATLPGPRNRT
jgi:hypothetical protein